MLSPVIQISVCVHSIVLFWVPPVNPLWVQVVHFNGIELVQVAGC